MDGKNRVTILSCLLFTLSMLSACGGSDDSTASAEAVPGSGSNTVACVWDSGTWDNCNWQ